VTTQPDLAISQELPTGIARYLPVLSWLPSYQRSWLRGDLAGGLSVWAVSIPMSLGYAEITGVPVQYGLYAALAGLIAFAVFTTSKHVTEGPSSVTAPVLGAGVLAFAAAGSAEAVAFAAATVFVAGLLFLLLRLFRMGWLVSFLAASVLTGFMFGVGINVAVGQLFGITGTHKSGSNTWQNLAAWFSSLSEANTDTVIVGVVALLIIFGLRWVSPRIPGGLVAVATGVIATVWLDLGSKGVQLTAEVPRGLPSLVLPDPALIKDNIAAIGGTAVAVMLIGFSLSMAAVRQYASKHNYRIDINQELVAQGMANVSSGAFQGIFVDGSLSRSPINDQAGARSQLSNLFQAALILLTLVLLAPMFSYLPQAVLAAVIFEAVVVGMMNVPEMKRLFVVKRSEFITALASLLGVLTFGVTWGVAIGVALSLVWLIHSTYQPYIAELGNVPHTDDYVDVAFETSAEMSVDLCVLRFDGGLYFANARTLNDRLREIYVGSEGKLTGVIISMEGVDFIDAEGAEAMKLIAQAGVSLGIPLYLARVKTYVIDVLASDGVVELIGADRIHNSVAAAVRAHRDVHPAI
jgi:high affinity sulfate transporter 1